MIIAPVTWCREIPGPYAPAVTAGSCLLKPIAACRYGEALAHQHGTKIAAANRARGEQAAVLVKILGAAVGCPSCEQCGHTITRHPATGPVVASGVDAVLGEFGRIKAEQANAVVAQAEAVAVAGARMAGYWGRRGIERRRSDSHNREDGHGQQNAARATKDGIVLGLSTQDFTAR